MNDARSLSCASLANLKRVGGRIDLVSAGSGVVKTGKIQRFGATAHRSHK